MSDDAVIGSNLGRAVAKESDVISNSKHRFVLAMSTHPYPVAIDPEHKAQGTRGFSTRMAGSHNHPWHFSFPCADRVRFADLISSKLA